MQNWWNIFNSYCMAKWPPNEGIFLQNFLGGTPRPPPPSYSTAVSSLSHIYSLLIKVNNETVCRLLRFRRRLLWKLRTTLQMKLTNLNLRGAAQFTTGGTHDGGNSALVGLAVHTEVCVPSQHRRVVPTANELTDGVLDTHRFGVGVVWGSGILHCWVGVANKWYRKRS